MKWWNGVLSGCILFGLIAGCSANRDLIVLLPDPDGRVGAIEVTTDGGSQTVDRAGYATEVGDSRKPPNAPKPIDENEVTAAFGAALSAQPDLTDRFVSFVLYFESDTIELTHESRELLPEIVKTIKDRKPSEVYVVGHTDRVGAEAYNLQLSSKRAHWVRDFLISRGIKSDTVVVSFRGEAIPLIYTEDEVAEPLNRRAEVFVR
jgi:outer membrane protein OmpA-like peptidoglycan-associated protein